MSSPPAHDHQQQRGYQQQEQQQQQQQEHKQSHFQLIQEQGHDTVGAGQPPLVTQDRSSTGSRGQWSGSADELVGDVTRDVERARCPAPASASSHPPVAERPAAGLLGPERQAVPAAGEAEAAEAEAEAEPLSVAVYASAGSSNSLGSTAAALLALGGRQGGKQQPAVTASTKGAMPTVKCVGQLAMQRSSSRQLFVSESRVGPGRSTPRYFPRVSRPGCSTTTASCRHL